MANPNVRYLLHRALLDEAADIGFGQAVPNCHQQMMAAGFCPSCGMALSVVVGRPRALSDESTLSADAS